MTAVFSYGDAHKRVHEARGPARGPARDHQCECGAQAQHWAYQYTGEPISLPEGTRWSADPADYAAMCISCHAKLDWTDESIRERRMAGAARAMAEYQERRRTDPVLQEVHRQAGMRGGARTAERLRTEPELAAKYRAVQAENGRKVGAENIKKGHAVLAELRKDPEFVRNLTRGLKNQPRRVCSECGLSTIPGPMAMHLKSSGHTGWVPE